MILAAVKDYVKNRMRSGRAFKKSYDELMRHDAYSQSMLAELESDMLKKIINHAYNKAPYYRRLFDSAGILPSDIKTAGDLKNIPVTTKEDVRKNYSDIVVSKQGFSAFTSGSTGKPLRLLRSMDSISYEHANLHRLFTWAGIEDGCRLAFIREYNAGNKEAYYFNYLDKSLRISPYEVHANMEGICAQLEKHGIEAVVCFPSSIQMLSKHIISTERRPLELKAVITSSESIDAHLRDNVSKALGCKVFDYYGQGERVCMIKNCEQGHYHIMNDYGAVNLRRENGNYYELISTNLFNYAMPLINYATDDIVELFEDEKSCACGRHYPVIKRIIGRKTEYMHLGEKIISTTEVTNIFNHIEGGNIVATQFLQIGKDELELNLVLEDAKNLKDVEKIFKNIEKYLGGEKERITVSINKPLVHTGNGKIPFFVKNVQK